MDYIITRAPNGNEVTTFTSPAPSCGDFPECHAEPPACDCPKPGVCEASDTVDDASFGYWHSAWGDSPVHEFPCLEPATVTEQDPYDGSPVHVCERHAR